MPCFSSLRTAGAQGRRGSPETHMTVVMVDGHHAARPKGWWGGLDGPRNCQIMVPIMVLNTHIYMHAHTHTCTHATTQRHMPARASG